MRNTKLGIIKTLSLILAINTFTSCVQNDVSNNYEVNDFVNANDSINYYDSDYEYENDCDICSEYYIVPGPIIFDEIENDNFNNQYNLIYDLYYLDESCCYRFFDDNVSKETIFVEYGKYIDLITELKYNGGTPERIVWELNNLLVLSYSPTGIHDQNAWIYYFALMNASLNDNEYSIYDKYIEFAQLVHEVSCGNVKKLIV